MSFSMEQVQKIFEEARGLRAEERAEFLDRACAGDAELRAEVESLLRHLDDAGGEFLKTYQSPAAQDPNATIESPPRIEVGDAGPGAGVKSPDGIFESARGLLGIPSDLIDGYTILRELHRGGQGIVYQAIQKGTKRKVAIKVLLEGPFASKSARRRFEREIELVARLRHANIVEVFHSGQTTDGRQYCVMDYVRGVNLDQYIKGKKPSMEEALDLFAKVCEAVNYAHQRGVIHRDLKPSNILVDSEGIPKVLDFGLAKMLVGPEETVVSHTGQLVGTLPYMSPEQAKGNPDEIDIRTDVYSLGVILYEVLTGTYPYPVVGQIAEVLKHIAETPPTPPSRAWNNDSGVQHRTSRRLRAGTCPIDDEVQTIVLRSLAKERDRRYQSAGELARDVEHYLQDEPIEAKKDSRLYILKTAIRRNKLPFAVAIASFFFITLFGISMARLAKQARDEKERADLASNERLIEQQRRYKTELETQKQAERSRPRILAGLLDAAVFLDKQRLSDLLTEAEEIGLLHVDLAPFRAFHSSIQMKFDEADLILASPTFPNEDARSSNPLWVFVTCLRQQTRDALDSWEPPQAIATRILNSSRGIEKEAGIPLNPLSLVLASFFFMLQDKYENSLSALSMLHEDYPTLTCKFHLSALLEYIHAELSLHDESYHSRLLRTFEMIRLPALDPITSSIWEHDLYCAVAVAICQSSLPEIDPGTGGKSVTYHNYFDSVSPMPRVQLLSEMELHANLLAKLGGRARASRWSEFVDVARKFQPASGIRLKASNPNEVMDQSDEYSILIERIIGIVNQPSTRRDVPVVDSGLADAGAPNVQMTNSQTPRPRSDSTVPLDTSVEFASRTPTRRGRPIESIPPPPKGRTYSPSSAGKSYEPPKNTGTPPSVAFAAARPVYKTSTQPSSMHSTLRETEPKPSRRAERVRRVNVKLAGPAIGVRPHYLAYSVDLPREQTAGADFLWMDNGVWIGDEPRGVKILESPGLHRISVLVVTADNIEYRGTATVQVLDRGRTPTE